MIQPSDRRVNLTDAINLTLKFNGTIYLDLIWKYKNQKMGEWFELGKTVKNYEALYVNKKNLFFSCVYKKLLSTLYN